MDFEKICMIFTMREPFYGILLSSMLRIPTSKISTLAVGKSGNVIRLYYNPDFVKPLPVDTVLELLKHEMLHVAFSHFTLWSNPPKDEQTRLLRNMATDMEVNGYLDVTKFGNLKPILAKDKGWDNKLGSLEYYRRLIQDIQQQQAQKQQGTAAQPQQQCNGGKGGKQKQQKQQAQSNNESTSQGQNCPQPEVEKEQVEEYAKQYTQIDEHDLWPDEDSDNMEQLQQILDDLVDFAAQEVEKGRGELPGEIVGRIESIRKKRPRPAADWKRYFRRYLGNEFSEFIRKSKKRESRRFPDAAGNRHRRKSHILVAIDTSGSVSMPEYMEFMGQIKTLTATADFHVIECDARIQYEYDYRNKPNETLHGGGGTDFQPVIDRYLKEKRKYDALVYFTDGYCPVPKNTPKDTLWVISSQGVKDRKPFQINGASCVLIPPKQQ
ncbi:MAG: hypothetical protein II661_00750 [Bacteroidales bacterium]|nr:hypothetical protein [Bacteroidales bacterium]